MVKEVNCPIQTKENYGQTAEVDLLVIIVL